MTAVKKPKNPRPKLSHRVSRALLEDVVSAAERAGQTVTQYVRDTLRTRLMKERGHD